MTEYNECPNCGCEYDLIRRAPPGGRSWIGWCAKCKHVYTICIRDCGSDADQELYNRLPLYWKEPGDGGKDPEGEE